MTFSAGDVLAGPIVRRVEPTLASVWIALRKPAAVRLELFTGLGPRRPADQIAPTSTPMPVAAPQVAGHTLKFGAELHVAVVMFEPMAPLEWGATYSYDLRITPDGGAEVGFDELGMLENGTYTGWFGERQSLALGYVPGHLPSFMLPGAQLNDLRLAHGSCRRDDGPGRDAMAILDDLLGDHNADPSQRIQQLWLTGDQIYANSAAPELMEDLTEVGKRLIAGDGPGGEFVTLTDPATSTEYTYPLDGFHFPAGRRLMLMNRVGGFTAVGNAAHAIGFGEFASMYLAAWHTNVWPDLLPKLHARRIVVRDYQVAQDAMENLALQVMRYAATRDTSPIAYAELPEKPHLYYYGWGLTPFGARRIDANLTIADLAEQWDDGESDTRNWARFWMQGHEHPLVAEAVESYKKLEPEPSPTVAPDPRLRFLARNLTPSWWAGKETFGIARDERDPPRALIGDQVRERLHNLKTLIDDVPRVRRALANVSTYMIFDDHEVCEDWNITAGWVTRVRGNALGRKVLRNGMAAYTVFQGWGNDPRAYAATGTPQAAAMAEIIATLLDTSGAAHEAPPLMAEAALDERFANQALTEPPLNVANRMRWHYRYDAPGLEIIALDSRTERSYEPEADPQIGQPFTSDANAALLSDDAMDRQIPAVPPPGVSVDGVCIVVAAAPVFGFPPEESLIAPLLQFRDLMTPLRGGRWMDYRSATHFGRITEDPEHWGLVPRTFERLLARLSTRRRVLFLSGDVHYACSHAMTYWRREDAGYLRSRFIQLTSSGLRNELSGAWWQSIELVQVLERAFSVPIERVGWNMGSVNGPVSPDPIAPPTSGMFTRFNERVVFLLQQDPIVIPPLALPESTQQLRSPDWAYRREILDDVRDDGERLLESPPPLLSMSEGIGVMALSVVDRVRWQAKHAPGRRWIPRANVGVVAFQGTTEAPSVCHSLYTFELSDQQSPGRPYVVVVAPLTASPMESIPAVPVQGGTQ